MDKYIYKVEAPATLIINALARADVRVKFKASSERELIAEVDEKDKDLFLNTIRRTGAYAEELNVRGARKSVLYIRKRIGLLVGLTISILLIIVYSLSVLNIEIEGNDRIDETIIMNKLLENGVKTPTFIRSFDTDMLEKELIEIDGVSFASVRVEGTKLIVNIREQLPETMVEDTLTPKPIIALSDGIITKIYAARGTAVVKIGDAVKKGDVIIAPYILDAEGNETPVAAAGEAYAKVWYESVTLYPDTIITKVRTGNEELKTAIVFNSLKYLKPSSFSTYETEIKETKVFSLLPFTILTVRYFETEDKEVVFDFEKEFPSVLELESLRLKSKLPENATEIRNWFFVKRLDKSTELSIYYEMEQKIV